MKHTRYRRTPSQRAQIVKETYGLCDDRQMLSFWMGAFAIVGILMCVAAW